ncbi:hypothetical protein ACQJBY_025987 [Aegilops geniculata]
MNHYFPRRPVNDYFLYEPIRFETHASKLRFCSRVVRIRSTTSVCLLLGIVLLPCGISGKMTIPSKSLLSLLVSCSLFCYAYAAIPTTCLSCLPFCQTKPLTHLVLANHCLAMLPLCSAPLIALLVAGEDEVCSLLEHGDVVPC